MCAGPSLGGHAHLHSQNNKITKPQTVFFGWVCVERAPCKLPWYFQFRNVDRSENCGCPFPRRPPTALRILYPARSRGRSRPAPQADARSSQVWCPSHTASPGCTLWCAPVPANGRTLTAAAANCRSFRCHTESVRPTSRRYCPLDPTALCGFTHVPRSQLVSDQRRT